MKTALKTLAVAAAFGLPVLAFAQTPGAGIINTVHDFANGDGSSHSTVSKLTSLSTTLNGTANSVGLCTFCHTPHSSYATTLLWNHTPSTQSYSWDTATTAAGTPYPTMAGNTYKGPTVKCLGCHDGTVSVGDVALYQGSKRNTGTSTTSGALSTYFLGYQTMQMGQPGVGGTLKTLTNMSGNHPVGMPYPYGNTPNTYNGGTNGTMLTNAEWVANPVGTNGTTIKLYNDTGSGNIQNGAIAGSSGIECGSCHDVHNKASVDIDFLRAKVAGSTAASGYICVQCHTK